MNTRDEQDRIWETLFQRQLRRVEEYACQAYLEGAARLKLPHDRVPELDELNAVITPATGWTTARTTVRYSDAVPWYRAFARKQFLVTDYMRDWSELEFTPEPDMFHDIFGHLPFMTLKAYADLQEMFAPAFLHADGVQREHIKRLAWFSTEFGMILEHGSPRVFGAGLISSIGEIENVMAGHVPLLPFTVQNVIDHNKAIYSFNDALFVFEDLNSLKAELAAYFERLQAVPLHGEASGTTSI